MPSMTSRSECRVEENYKLSRHEACLSGSFPPPSPHDQTIRAKSSPGHPTGRNNPQPGQLLWP